MTILQSPEKGLGLKIGLCFFLSGLSSLMYETVWVEEFSLLFGTSELAVSIVLASFMGGLALGAFVLSRWKRIIRKPVKIYATMELLIGLWAFAIPILLSSFKKLYAHTFLSPEQLNLSLGNHLFNLGTAIFLIVPPTALMGATLPLLATMLGGGEKHGKKSIATLYGLNTLGAAAGCGITTFYFLPEFHLNWTTYFAVSINVVVFLLIFPQKGGENLGPKPRESRMVWHPILLLVFASGLLTFSSEVFWVRLLSHPLGSSVFSFGTMLITYLAGIGLGALCTRPFLNNKKNCFSIITLGLFGFGAWITLFFQVDNAFFSNFLAEESQMQDWQKRIGISVLSLFPCSFSAGMIVPAAIGFLEGKPGDLASRTGQVLAINTLGNIFGALITGFLLLPKFHFEGTALFLITTSMILCLLSVWSKNGWSRSWGAFPVLVLLLVMFRPLYEPMVILKSSLFSGTGIKGNVTYLGVGLTSTVMIAEQPTGWRLSTTGLPESLFVPPNQISDRLVNTKWMTALPGLVNPSAKEMLIVGLGGGANLSGITQQWDSVDIVEIEKEIVKANQAMDELLGTDRLSDPRFRHIIQDARQVLELNPNKYDAIISQPSHPWTGGAAHLYTHEFFQVVHAALKPGGTFCQWMGLKFVDESLLNDLVSTIKNVFPHVLIFEPEKGAFLFLCSNSPLQFSWDHLSIEDKGRLMDIGIFRMENIYGSLIDFQPIKGVLIKDRRNPFKTQFLKALRSEIQTFTNANVTSNVQPNTNLDPMWLEYESIRLHGTTFSSWFQRADEIFRQKGQWQEWVEYQNWTSLHPTQQATIMNQILARQISQEYLEKMEPFAKAIILGHQKLRNGDISNLKTLEDDLSICQRDSPLFPEAAMLRIIWRLKEDEKERHTEACEILQTLRGHTLNSQILVLQWIAAKKTADTLWEKSAWHTFNQIKTKPQSRQNKVTQLILKILNEG